MFKRPAFWIAFTLVSAVLGALAARFFADAFPLVTLDLRMERDSAFDQARRLADERGWGPDDFRQAASFGVEGGVRDYVELEGGGKEAFGEMIRGGLFSPYTWEVRHFRPGETTETRVRFTPGGRPYGFRETLPEDEVGPSLGQDAARHLAEDATRRGWEVDLSAFELAEASQVVRPGGRTDHTFVYERTGIRVGEEGTYRLRLTVSGDRFTELTHFVKVPEAFSRRFEEMRSTNDFIAAGSVLALFVLYLAGGCGLGLFFLFRERWVIWKTPVFWGLFVAFLQLLVGLNQWPLQWMGYDTAVSVTNFVLQNLAFQLAGFVGLGLFFILAFMGAESLTRRAFPDQVQFWKAWTDDVASSPQILGQTVAGYLLVAVFFAYEVGLYFFTHRLLGWWSPSDALFDPDSLATYFPWLPAIGISLQAGFMEECLFRAVPLASAALLGRRFGRRRLWILGALLLQALVFGAGHANYPNQPAFARVVELVLPSIGFGLVYLRFGLVPVIVLHFAFDVVWFALPLFVSDAPGAWVNQSVVVALALVPLLVVVAARLKSARWRDVDEGSYNRAWEPPPPRAAKPAAAPLTGRLELSGRRRLVLLAAGAAGVVLWLASSPFTTFAPPITVGRSEAVEAARQALEERGVELDASWKTLSTVEPGTGLPHLYVWRKGGEEVYRELLGRFLATPRWWVRFARFEGEVTERAEEYQVWISGNGEVTRFQHRLPEGRPGADLPEEEARMLAHAALAEGYSVDAAALEEVSAAPTKQPERRDWRFTYKSAESFPLEEGEAWIAAEIAGDEVTHTYRTIHLPEDWERDERDRSTLITVVRVVSGGALLLIFVAAVLAAVVRWTRKRFAVGVFLRFTALMLVVGVVTFANRWPAFEIGFSTAQPYWMQALMLGLGLIGVGMVAVGVGFAAGLVHGFDGLTSPAAPSGASALLPGPALGAVAAGVAASAGKLGPSLAPTWPDFGDAGSRIPLLGAAVSPVSSFVTGSVLFFLIFTAVDVFTRRWRCRRWLFTALFLVLGLVLAGLGDLESLPMWLVSGAAQGALLLAAYVFVLRRDLTLVPLALAAMNILSTLREGALQAYPGALAGALAGALLVGLLAVCWSRSLRPPTAVSGAS